MVIHNANLDPVLSEYDNKSIIVCEAVNCYEVATESIAVSVGKFGTLTLNLCRNCLVKKFGK